MRKGRKHRERVKERNRDRVRDTREKTLATGSEMGRKFSSSAFICSLNEMRMHYTWIAGDINFLPWTCSGPRARQDAAGLCRAARERVGGNPPGI